MDTSGDQGPRDNSAPLVGNVSQDGIEIHLNGKKALDLGLYQTPRVEDNPIKKHQRIHDISSADSVALPLYDAKLASRWKPPPTREGSREGSIAYDFLVPVRGIVTQGFVLLSTIKNCLA